VNRRRLLIGVSSLACVSAWSAPPPHRFLVLFSEAPEPERTLLRVVREAFGETARIAGASVIAYPVPADRTVSELQRLLDTEHPTVLVALGRTAIALARAAHSNLPLTVGVTEMPIPSEGISGISLAASPTRVFATLVGIAPAIRSVSLVIEPERLGWLRPYVEQASRLLSLELALYNAPAISTAAKQYLDVLQRADPGKDSLWLLGESEFLTPDILPRIIEEAWARDFVVFSSVLEHVREGALFAPYLNPRSLGTRLARIAVAIGSRPAAFALDDDPGFALNIRTARHLARVVDMHRAREFDLILGNL
jgi:putative ABC transport system substrate-binding protein